MKCDGECSKDGTCKGAVKPVKVSGNGFKGPFTFNYCNTAIKEDMRRGFTVTVIVSA